jgi:hypothetical protein
MALLDIVAPVTPGVDPLVYVDRPDTVPLGIVIDSDVDQAVVELSAATGGGSEQVFFYNL